METAINKETKSFSSEWWDDFLGESENFTKTNVFKDVISKDDVSLLNGEIIKVLQEIYTHKTNQYGFRVYLDGKEQDNTYMSKLFETPPTENETIEDYTKRIFDEQKFGMILNRTEKFSEKMAHDILLKIQPLLDKVGIPLTGLSAHILIGNYGWTPLGIHQDTRGDNVIHFHLGPGPKIMYNWEEEKYKELTGKKDNNKDIEPLLPFADEYPFETGDLYFMPWNKYHIGFSDELSVGLTIWFNNPTKKTFTSRILDTIHLQYLNDDKEILDPDKNTSIDASFNDIESVINLDENLKKLSFTELMKHLHRQYKLAIISNGGWSNIPISLKDKMQYVVDKYEVLENKKVITPYPFKTYYEKIEEELIIFARGYKVKIKYHIELEVIIDKLNKNQEEDVSELLKTLTQDWPIEAGLYFLSLLYDKRAINIIENN
ncbi:hypothetical protein [Flavobacterium psychrophilum]|uniref:hypothetical protein n=1 Tax=Flavobacterium psychrophilum TaxID=96345 RepID=UPI000B7C3CCD|nr:hypothetical protein [Flavobacterium psychrophilum]SNA68977.1 putative RNA methylase [Flavobacterium psychrophilum]SNB01129.1 putative RNA methylase [Flavobacterium psychrophilum]